MVKSLNYVVATPFALPVPSLAIAASRSGHFGILDLEYNLDHHQCLTGYSLLQRHGQDGHCGFKIHTSQQKLLSELLAVTTQQQQTVILTSDYVNDLDEFVAQLHGANFRILLEMTDSKDVGYAEALKIDGLIAKGNEASGRVGEETTFVLLQSLRAATHLPIYAQGGIGIHTAAACYIAGAAGVVLDSQMLLAKESPLSQTEKSRIARMDGSETLCIGGELGAPYRLFAEPGSSLVSELQQRVETLAASSEDLAVKQAQWRNEIAQRVGWSKPRQNLLLIGQDSSFASSLAGSGRTVAEIISRIAEAVESHIRSAAHLKPLAEGSPLAERHGTRYPIVQGPMTRVSDTVEFAAAVAKDGGLPFIALALMRQREAAELLHAVKDRLGGQSWGVGILGFVPQELRQEQLAIIREVHPNYVIVAGGRPDQAIELENEGIQTYLHVPSANLLQIFLADGATRFIFEGRECGGHVGPRTSFVLWNNAVEVLLAHLQSGGNSSRAKEAGKEYSILFAGGIHDGLSGAMVSALCAPLCELGVNVGVLMGTAYLFTHEATSSGAILPRYQEEALRSDGTVLVETGLGHVTRCLRTPFVDTFKAKKQELTKSGLTSDQIRDELEALNVGRLRIASKGITRNRDFGVVADALRYVALGEEQQYAEGMYMIGQVAGLMDSFCSIAELHADLADGSVAHLESAAEEISQTFILAESSLSPASEIAIVGMACVLPGAKNLEQYWSNILNSVDSITEIPRERFDWRLYFDEDRNAADKIYSRWGGFIEDVPFNPIEFGMPPNTVPAIEPMQLLMLEVVRSALDDAGYRHRPFPREETSVIMAVGGGLGDRGFHYSFRTYLPHFLEADPQLTEQLNQNLPEWTEDSFPGMLLNVLSGRVANRFDLGGPNFVVDAACGSSLAALDIAVKDLELGRTKMAIVGAADTVQSPFGFMAFSKTQALSPTGRCRPLDVNADGIAISEGLAVVVLKKLADAVHDGDKIYAVIQGVGSSSDGRDRSLTAPRAEGQLRALRRAYAKASFPPNSVDLFEAHGTGTKLGDAVEIEALQTLLQEGQIHEGQNREGQPPVGNSGIGAAVGSVKSMIGHTKSTAGLAGLIKVALGLYHKVLPPTLIDKPNPKVSGPDSAIYVNNMVRPWLRHSELHARRAGVSAFGFGGTNFHVAMEEYAGNYLPLQGAIAKWPVELMLFAASTTEGLLSQADRLARWLDAENKPPLQDLSYTLYRQYRQQLAGLSAKRGSEEPSQPWLTVALVVSSLGDLRQKLDGLRSALESDTGAEQLKDIFFASQPLAAEGKVAFLFPGQGSQYPNMFRELFCAFPEMLEPLQQADDLLEERLSEPLSSYIFPRPTFGVEEEKLAQAHLTNTAVAQPALGAVSVAASRLLAAAGIHADVAGGHSYGELVALWQAGVFSLDNLFLVSATRGHLMAEAAGAEAGTMAAIKAPAQAVADLLNGLDEITLANLNTPNQTVISGSVKAMAEALQRCVSAGYRCHPLSVACAFHSPFVATAEKHLAGYLDDIHFGPARCQVFANTHGQAYPQEPAEMRTLLSQQLARPVYFQKQIEAMYEDGARIFVEVGPRRVLSGLVKEILAEHEHIAVALDGGMDSLSSFVLALAQLAAHGLQLELDSFFDRRNASHLNLSAPYQDPAQARLGATTWLVNGGSARPLGSPSSGFTPLPIQLRKSQVAAEIGHVKGSQGQATLPAGRAESQRPEKSGVSLAPSPNGAHTAKSSAIGARPMSSYHQLMDQFLVAHTNVVQAYLGKIQERNQRGNSSLRPGGQERRALTTQSEEAIMRYAVTPVEIPPLHGPSMLPVGAVILVIGGEEVLAKALASSLLANGQKWVWLRSTQLEQGCDRQERPGQTEPSCYSADFTDLEELQRVLAAIRQQHSALHGIVYLPTTSKFASQAPTYAEWQQRWHSEFVGLLHIIQVMHGDLAAQNSPPFLAATTLGHCFDGSVKGILFALQGGIAGMLKTLAHELPSARIKVVDLDLANDSYLNTEVLLQELAAQDDIVEVAYQGTSRYIPQLTPATTDRGDQNAIHIDSESVILLIGGARGITATVAEMFARTYRPKLILVGRSPLPEAEMPETVGLTSMAEIKASLIKKMQKTGQQASLAEVEKAYRRLIANRQLQQSLSALKQSGAQIYYRQADVRNEAEFSGLIQSIYARFGRLDGVIHGAGLLEDKLLRDKQGASLQRVVSTKIDSAFLLSRAIQPQSLQFLVFFSSVSGRFGNRGQGDYAAANEVLNKMARQLDRQWPGRVFAINWGPWDAVGMVNEELRQEFGRRGVALIPPQAGCTLLAEELSFGSGAPEILIAGSAIQNMQHRTTSYSTTIAKDVVS